MKDHWDEPIRFAFEIPLACPAEYSALVLLNRSALRSKSRWLARGICQVASLRCKTIAEGSAGQADGTFQWNVNCLGPVRLGPVPNKPLGEPAGFIST